MTQSSRTFRIFVSSTFSDLKAERNALQERVFPRLRDLAAAHGCRFQVIDLRWGVSEEAAVDQQTMKICLGEIERCQKTSPRPNFIVLLGDRYGWRPVPAEIPADEFENIIPLLAGEDTSLLEQWYRRDDNAVPPVYVLQPRAGEFVEYERWENVETALRRALRSAVTQLSLSPDALLKYTASATEQEIVAGALQVADAREHVFCFLRNIQGLPGDAGAAAFCETDSQAVRRQSELKARLRQSLAGNVHEYTARWQGDGPALEHLGPLCADVYRELSKVILAETGKLETVDPLNRELAAHETFGKDRARVFVGRVDLLNALEAYISGNDPHPLAIWGASGSGKSAAMAKAVEQARHHGQEVIYRFIGASPESSNGRALLESLCQQIARRYGADETTIPSEYRDLVQEFPKRLALAMPDRPLILFLDALDQLSDTDHARSLAWLPGNLPPHVRLIVSTLPGECLKVVESKLPAQSRLEVPPMSVEDGKAILDTWLEAVHRKLQDQQEQSLLDKFKHCGLPLYLKLAFEEARLWKSYSALPELSGDIPGILSDLFKRLSQETHHGGMLVARSLGYLAAARNGLSEDELLDVLSRDPEVLADFQRRSPKSPAVERLPVVIWSRLHFDLEPYLTERSADGASLWAFYHRQVSEAANAAYLAGQEKSRRHQTLAEYFREQPLRIERAAEQTPNLRKLSEQPYQQTYGGMGTALLETLADYWFMETKIGADSVQALIEDYQRAQSAELLELQDGDREALRLILGVLRLALGALRANPHELAGQLHGRLRNCENSVLGALLAQAATKSDRPWLRPLLGDLQEPGEAAELVLTGHSQGLRFVVLTHDGRHVVSFSHDRSLRVWNIDTGAEEFLLEEGNQLHALEVTPDDEFAVALDHNYELKIWNLHTGRLEKTLWTCAQPCLLTPDSRHVVVNHTSQKNVIGYFELKLINIITGNEERSFVKNSPVSVGAITPDGENLIWAAGPRVTICGLAHDELKGSFEYEGSVRATTVTADGKYLVAQTAVNPTYSHYRVIDLTSMKEQFTIECSYCSQVYATPSGLYHLSYAKGQASANTKHVLRNLSTGEERVLECDRLQIEGSVLSPDGAFLASSNGTGSRGSSRFLDLNTGRIVVKSGFIRCWGFTRDAQKAILESSDHTLVIADLGKLMLDNRSAETKEIIWPVAVTPDDQYAFLRAGPNLKAWNLINRQEEFVLRYAHDWMVLSPDGRTVYSGTGVWDLNTRTQSYLASTGMNSSDSIHGMVIAADGAHAVAWATSDGVNACIVWSLQTRRVEQLLKFKDAWRCAVSPTGRRFAYLSRAQPSVSVWDIAGGREERVIQNMEAKLRFQALAFTHSGDSLLIAGERGDFGETCDLSVCDLEGDENEMAPLEAKYLKPMGVVHRSTQEILVNTIDGKWVVTRSSNNDLMIWNLAQRRFQRQIAGQCASASLNQQHFAFASGSQVGIYDLEQAEIAATFHTDHEVRGVSLTKDGKTLIAGDEAGNLHLLQLEAGI